MWSLTDQLLAAAVDALTAANWQRGGGKGKQPKRIPRPGVKDESTKPKLGGGKTLPLKELNRLLLKKEG
jgi:hypothetical protein